MPSRPPAKLFIREWREYRSLTQQSLAERVGMATASLYRIEQGQRTWNAEHLTALAEALACDPVDLFRPPQT